jgi:hypothetical protein
VKARRLKRLNTRAKSDRPYHLLISLRAGKKPDAQTLRVIEERFCKELGYAEHQRVSVVHHDTDKRPWPKRSPWRES